MIDVHLIRAIPIEAYLTSRGIEPVRQNGHDLWYRSPLREGDRTPSFVVHRNTNYWKDFSDGQGGSVIDLALLLGQRPYLETLQSLSDFAPEAKRFTPAIPELRCAPGDTVVTPRSFSLLKVKPLGSNQRLVDYVRQRHIDPAVAARHGLQEVYYLNTKGKRCFALGFPNDAGGYEIRNPYFKGTCGNKAITTVTAKDPSSAVIFEGFMDYLSYRQLHPGYDGMAVVLNSTALAAHAVPAVRHCASVSLLLDNDATGSAKTAELTALLAREAPHCRVTDGRSEYAAHNDLNDYLQAVGTGMTTGREEARAVPKVARNTVPAVSKPVLKANRHKSLSHKF